MKIGGQVRHSTKNMATSKICGQSFGNKKMLAVNAPDFKKTTEITMKAKSEPAFVKVLETDSLTDIAMIKSVLDAGDVQYFLQGENMKFIRPVVGPAILMVSEKDVKKAIKLLKPLNSIMCICSSGLKSNERELLVPKLPAIPPKKWRSSKIGGQVSHSRSDEVCVKNHKKGLVILNKVKNLN